MSDIQSQFATLSPEQRRLLELLAHKQATAAASAAAEEAPPTDRRSIPLRTGTGPAPLSFGQQRLWMLDQFQPGSTIRVAPDPAQLHVFDAESGQRVDAGIARSAQA